MPTPDRDLSAVIAAGEEGLAAAFLMAPARAIRWFEALGVRITWNWRDDLTRALDYAFTIRKVADLDVLAAVRRSVHAALAEGITQREFRRRVSNDLRSSGWLGPREVTGPDGQRAVVDLSAPHRLNVIFRTNAQSAYMAGRFLEQREQADVAPFWQYIAVLDERTRPAHAAMSGKVYRHDDPIWRRIYPPNGYNCRCRVRTYTAAQLEARGLRVSSSVRDPGEPGFPDPGFEFNPGLVNAQDAAIHKVTERARERAERAMRGEP